MTDEDDWIPPAEGSRIRLMCDHTVQVPLWSDDHGLLFNDADDLLARGWVSTALAEDIVAWAADWPERSTMPSHRAEAASLVRRLDEELGHRYRFAYKA